MKIIGDHTLFNRIEPTTQITLRRAGRDKAQRDTASSKFHQRRGGAVRSKRARDGLSSSSLGCAPTTLSDNAGYQGDQQ